MSKEKLFHHGTNPAVGINAHGKKNFVLVIERSNDLISGQGTIGGIVGHPVLCQFLFLRFLQALNDEGRNIAENSTCKKIVRN